MRRHEVEQGAALAGLGQTQPWTLERGRRPPGHTRVPCEELADGWGRMRALSESADRTP